MKATILPTPMYHTQPPTTHLALNACEALRRPSLCEARVVKDEDRWISLVYDLFSGKQLTAVMCMELRKQKPLPDALDGLCLQCEEHDTDSMGRRSCLHVVEASKLVIRKPLGA